ncbi:endoplasmic reticulum protein [Trichosporon asahii var. asahii CBS 8904]|uniref:Endoplasmic reticulum transmembrane protein n=1 Tax=Trichosporon asahii var. asahii (strain CBS 8904) TaxID=1220162 RepID=K1VBV4_TRIAC|nr:endoplasmic reticulum protein [Trichosporon asahii var. asahii CBS 8904]
MFHFLAENPAVAKVQYALKITFIFVAVLFIDALQRMVRIAQEGAVAKRNPEVAADVRTETTYVTVSSVTWGGSDLVTDQRTAIATGVAVPAVVFLRGAAEDRGVTIRSPTRGPAITPLPFCEVPADIPVYLTGTTLFLSLVLSRVFYILLDFIQTQEELTTLKGSTAKGSTNAGENAELRKKIKVLQAELETVQSDADRDLSTLKKQANQQAAEYNRLADEHNASTGAVSDKKFD